MYDPNDKKKKMSVVSWSIVKIIFSLLIIILLLIFILIPAPIKFILNRFTVDSDYDLLKVAKKRDNYTLYSLTNDDDDNNRSTLLQTRNNNNDIISSSSSLSETIRNVKKRRLLVWFHGGAFIFSDRRMAYGLLNNLFEKISKDTDILVFDYPVRFRHTLRDSLLSINKTLGQFVGLYDEFYSGSISAGTLLMGAFQNKESSPEIAARMKVPIIGVQFKAMIGVCGVYDTRFDSRLLNVLFDFYIMRGTPAPETYTCYNANVPFLVIGSTGDYLFMQTHRFINTHPCDYHIFNDDNLTHVFPLLQNIRESREVIEKVVDFLNK